MQPAIKIGDRYSLHKRRGCVPETAVYEIVKMTNPCSWERESNPSHAVAKKVLKNNTLSKSVQVMLPFSWFRNRVE